MTGKRSEPSLMALIEEVAAISGVSVEAIIGSVEDAAGQAASGSAGGPLAVRLDRKTGRFHRLAPGESEGEGDADLRQLARPILRAARRELGTRLQASRLLAGGERFRNRIGMLETGRVAAREGGDLIVDLGASRARLPAEEQSRHEVFNPDDTVRAVVLAVRPEDPPVILSRIAPAVVAGALEREVPEVRSGAVQVRGAARIPGVRAKVAVASESRNLDPVACCLGPGGSRIRAVSRELRGERVDVVRWHADPAVFARHALGPASALSVGPDPDAPREGALLALVTHEELPRALGKRGQNVRLAAELLGVSLEVRARDAGSGPDRGPRGRRQERGRAGPRRREDSFRRGSDGKRRGPGPSRRPGRGARAADAARIGRRKPGAGDSLRATSGPAAGAEEVGARASAGSQPPGGAV